MKATPVYELELHHAGYIEERMTALRLSSIALSVPSVRETLLINAPKVPESRPIVLEVEKPGEKLTVHRADLGVDTHVSMPLQIREADMRMPTFGQDLFETAVASLTYTRVDDFVWNVDVDAENITDAQMFRDFTGILANFAWMRQEGLI